MEHVISFCSGLARILTYYYYWWWWCTALSTISTDKLLWHIRELLWPCRTVLISLETKYCSYVKRHGQVKRRLLVTHQIFYWGCIFLCVDVANVRSIEQKLHRYSRVRKVAQWQKKQWYHLHALPLRSVEARAVTKPCRLGWRDLLREGKGLPISA